MQHTPTLFEYSAFQAHRHCTVMKFSVPHFCETDENDTYHFIIELLYKGFTGVLRSSTKHATDNLWMLTKPSCRAVDLLKKLNEQKLRLKKEQVTSN